MLSQESVSTEAILSKLSRATEIEKELESIAISSTDHKSTSAAAGQTRRHPTTLSAGTDEKNQALRLQLCGIFSDVILVDCTLAHTHDAVGRLWKWCFYSRIDELRARIVLGKRSVAKRHQATTTSTAAVAGGVGGGMDPSKKIVVDLEKQLSTFLDESIQLYKYIIERYVKELMPLSQSQSSTIDNGDDEEERERHQAIIISLYRMNIHLGDLYRYSTSYKLAEECYLLSAQLSPGTGNPYNQLAVVAQQSPDSMTTLALYYYARSLMATVVPFETSRSNLLRLFEANHRWITDHKRDDPPPHQVRAASSSSSSAAGIMNVMNIDGMTKKEQKEWMHKQRTAANRMALARVVDLQWVLYRGCSLENGDSNDGKTELNDFMKEMSSLHETLTNLMEHASFSESLLCKLVVILSFSTLGASNGGKLITADRFESKRAKDPNWNEAIIMSNQALAFSFCLRFCAMLAKDVDAMIVKKEVAGSLHKLGAIRLLPSLLLGFRFVTSIYEGCEWFHGLSYFPSGYGADDNDGAGKRPRNSAITKLCTESHEEFWSSIAMLANRMDTLPNQIGGNPVEVETDLADVRDFVDYHGYAPFASFLDKCDSKSISSLRKSRTIKYATVDEAIHALTKSKPDEGNNGGDATTMAKIKIFLSIANRKTCPTSTSDGKDDGQYFLSRVAGSNSRVLANISNEREEIVFEEQTSPTFMDDVHTVDMGVEDIHEAIMEQSPPKEQSRPKSSLSGIREGLLTPAALLAANADQPLNITVHNEAMEPPSASRLESIVQWNTNTDAPPLQSTTSARDIDSLLNNSLPLQLQMPAQPPLHAPTGITPPPGFTIQPQQGLTQFPLAPSIGISSTEYRTPQQYEHDTGGMISQAGSRFSSSNTLFETLNPFAHQAQLPSFNNDFFSGGINHQPGFDLRVPTERGLDTTLDFLLSSNRMQSTDDLASSNTLDRLVHSTAEPQDPAESILNFLFDSNDSTKAGPFYHSQSRTLQTQHNDVSHTKNPFAT